MPTTDQNKIQAEESDYLYIKESQLSNSGNGLFTAIAIYKEEIIATFNGSIVPIEEIKSIIEKGNDRYFMNLPNGDTLDCMHTDGFAKYANDACGLIKSTYKNNAKIAFDENNNVCLIAIQKIKSGNEIFCNYGKLYWKKRSKPSP